MLTNTTEIGTATLPRRRLTIPAPTDVSPSAPRRPPRFPALAQFASAARRVPRPPIPVAFALAVLAVLATVAPEPAAAQTATTFISNTGQTDVGTNAVASSSTPRAQQFTTGSNAGGYTLSAVVVNIRAGSTDTPAFALHQSTTASGVEVPGTKVVDLTGSITTAGEQSFTPASTTTLSTSTKYFVVLSTSGASGVNIQRTGSDDEDSGGSTGWEIANNSVFSTNSGSTWMSSGSSIEIAIKGTIVSGTNNPPTVANTIPDQTATVGTAFSYVFPANTFSDADTSDTLTYTATKADGTALPLWLAFAAGTRTFSGTPTAAGMVALKVTASDGNGGSVSDTFDITVSAAADTTPPTLTSATVLGSGDFIELQFSENILRSSWPSSDTVTVTAAGSAVTGFRVLPAVAPLNAYWIELSTAIRQGQAVVVTYTDPTSGNDANAFQDIAGNDAATFTTGMDSVPAVTNNSTVTNTPPTVANAIPDQTATVGTAFSYAFPDDHVHRRGHRRHPDLHGDESRRHGAAHVAGLRRRHAHLLGHANGRGDGGPEGDRQRRQRRVGQRYLRYHGCCGHHPAHADHGVNEAGHSARVLREPALSNLASAFTVTAGGSAVTVGGVLPRPGAPDVFVITVSPAIRQGQAIVVTYTDPTAGDDATAFQDTAGNDAATFTTGSDGVPAVTNASTVVPVTTATEVPADWSLKPTAVTAGTQFRLLFLSSTKRTATATDIATYNTFIQTRAAAGHTDIRDYSAGFRAVGCTAAVDARDNTATTYTTSDKGVPIYWLNGAKAADQYEDFYDGSWDDEANDKNESGTNGPDTSQNNNRPVTGCSHDGTELTTFGSSRALGAAQVSVGRPNSSGSGRGPLFADALIESGFSRPMYGLSGVFQVAAAVVVPNNPPTVANAIPDQTATVGTAFSYVFPANTFSDADTSDTLTYTATKAADTALPLWLAFAASTRTFSGTPTAAGMVALKVTASDGNGGSVSDTFDITVAADTTPPTLTSAEVDVGEGLGVDFEFSENLQRSNPPPASAFTVTVDGSAATVSSVGVPGSLVPQNQLFLTVSPVITQGQAVVVSYTDPTASDDASAIQDVAGNDAASFTTGSDGVPAVINASIVVPAATEVPADWSLKPTAVTAGTQFRLLFLSSTKRNASSTDIADYNTFIQGLAAAGHADIQTYSTGFRAVGCTADTDARDNTYTTYTSTDKGVPIYWLNGAQAADEYEDFYDGSWDDEANDKNESGTNAHDTSQTDNYPWTGCNQDGTEAISVVVGFPRAG